MLPRWSDRPTLSGSSQLTSDSEHPLVVIQHGVYHPMYIPLYTFLLCC